SATLLSAGASATSQLSPPSLHDALPIYRRTTGTVEEDLALRLVAAQAELLDLLRRGRVALCMRGLEPAHQALGEDAVDGGGLPRSEEHTSELQSREKLVCPLLLEKKKER